MHECKMCTLKRQNKYREKNNEGIKEKKRLAYAKDKNHYTSMLGSFERNDIFSWRSLRHVGKVYKNWTVLKLTGYMPIENHSHSKRTVMADVQCICGKIENKRLNGVTNNGVFGCGCIRANPDREQMGFNRLKKDYLYNAKKRNLEFKLSDEIMKKLVKNNCYYCGMLPSNKIVTKTGSEYFYNGIDRKNNSIGYTLDNCVSSCYCCNKSKMAMNHDDWLHHIERIYKWIIQPSQALEN